MGGPSLLETLGRWPRTRTRFGTRTRSGTKVCRLKVKDTMTAMAAVTTIPNGISLWKRWLEILGKTCRRFVTHQTLKLLRGRHQACGQSHKTSGQHSCPRILG